MDERWTEIETCFDELVEMGALERVSALARIGDRDPALRAELESLLSFASNGHSVLDRPAAETSIGGVGPVPGVAASRGDRIGAYRILELIGRGGMGEVYRAERADGKYTQQVALKVIRPGAGMPPTRFEVERQILADLGHPGIARLLAGGVTGDGHPFMVMELVEGRQIVSTGAAIREPISPPGCASSARCAWPPPSRTAI